MWVSAQNRQPPYFMLRERDYSGRVPVSDWRSMRVHACRSAERVLFPPQVLLVLVIVVTLVSMKNMMMVLPFPREGYQTPVPMLFWQDGMLTIVILKQRLATSVVRCMVI